MGLNPNFWRGRKVFVTGHTGFKGGWLCYWLRSMGAQVTGYALDPDGDINLFGAADIGRGITDIRSNIMNADALQAAIGASDPDVLFHMAAQPLVRASYGAPLETFQTNVIGTINLFEAVRRRRRPCHIVNVTTDKCYLNREWIWPYREDEPLGGHDPYSASKACVELATASFRSSFFDRGSRIRLASVRAGNVIGGGDWAPDRILPDLTRGFSKGYEVVLRNPASIRPWQHVLDALYGYLLLAQKLAGHDGRTYAEAWNFGPDAGGEMHVGAIARLASEAWGPDARYKAADVVSGPHEASILRLDSTKARQRLAWLPKYDLEQMIVQTVRWYRTFYDGEDVRLVMDDQISSFMPS